MTPRGLAAAHFFIMGANVALALMCTLYAVKALAAGIMGLVYFDGAVIVGNIYMAYFNFCEAKKLL
jgi:hypothetical protein